MLIEFAVTNFRSFKERQVLSMLPSGKIRERQIAPLTGGNYTHTQILPTGIIYGPNNFGKSNLIRAIRGLKWMVSNSGSFNSDKTLEPNDFFFFDKQTKNKPTLFEIDFIAPNQKRYQYNVEFDLDKILKEELYVYSLSKEEKSTINTLYKREQQDIKFTKLKGPKESISFKPNQLFLSRGDIADNKELKEVYSYFSRYLSVLQFTETEYTEFLTKRYAEFVAENGDSKLHNIIEAVLREMNTGFIGIETNLVDVSKIKFPEGTTQELKDKVFENIKYEIRAKHPLFDGKEEIGYEFLRLKEESTGTRKLLGLMPLILSSLEDGDTLIIDELNTSLHTELTAFLVQIFNNPKTNPNKAQLIITTHDIMLLDKKLYDMDQIFVIDKDKFGASELYSFADFTGIRKNDRLSDFYETGRFGGIPHIAKPYLEYTIQEYLQDAKAETEQKEE